MLTGPAKKVTSRNPEKAIFDICYYRVRCFLTLTILFCYVVVTNHNRYFFMCKTAKKQQVKVEETFQRKVS